MIIALKNPLMRILTLLACCFMQPLMLSSQITSTLDYEDIETEIILADSDYYYPLLLSKFHSEDSTITSSEGLYLYYGWVFQTNYNPVENLPFQDSLKKYMNTEYGYGNNEEMLLSFCDSVLIEEPLNLNILHYKLYFYSKMEMNEAYDDTKRKMDIILDAIFLSGNGTTMDNAMYVVDQSDVPCAMKFKFHTYLGESTIQDGFQYMKTAKDGSIDMLYFNIGPCLNYISEM